MFRGFSQIFNKYNKDLRRRIYITLACLALFALGSGVTIPWASEIYQDLGFLEIFNIMSGGGLRNFSIFALGVSPYITASIITQLLQMDIIPYFKELKDQGFVGRQKINKINRYMGIIIGFFQAYVLCVAYMGDVTTFVQLKTALVMTAGTAFCLWMGDQITTKGIGNGQSMMIMAGIILSMPSVFAGAYNGFINGTYEQALGIFFFSLFILVYILIIVGIIWIQLAERRIQIQYANKSTSSYGNQNSFLPIKLNSAGVMPVIFASILTTIPATIVAVTKNEKAMEFVNNYIVYNSPTGFILYILLILFFGYFYTFMLLNPEEMSKKLNERGGYIPGIRPGEDTCKYISGSMGKLTFVGSIFLVILSAIPVLFSLIFKLSSAVTIGGTGMLIVVGVAIQAYQRLESSLVSRSYTARRKRLR